MIDYKKILISYIAHVSDWEGEDFLHCGAPAELSQAYKEALYECAGRTKDGEFVDDSL